MKPSDVSNEMLTSFLDGEVDDETSRQISELIEQDSSLASRLEALKIPMADLQETFAFLQASEPIGTLPDVSADKPRTDGAGIHAWMRPGLWVAVAATILAFAAGAFTGHMTHIPESDQDWRVAVAEYHALYSKETLVSAPSRPPMSEEAVQHVSDWVGTPVSREMIDDLEGLTFKRAQRLHWQGAPLAQFVFQNVDGEPVAFCATPTTDEDQPIGQTVIKELASSSWVQDSVAYMIIGGNDPASMASLARQLRDML